MILTWATFGDQLAGAFEKDHEFLNEVLAFLIEKVKSDHKN